MSKRPIHRSPSLSVGCCPRRPIFRHYVLLPAFDPVRLDALLRVGQRHLSLANSPVQLVLEAVLFVRARARVIRFWPKVLDLIRPPEFEREQVIDFATARPLRTLVFR